MLRNVSPHGARNTAAPTPAMDIAPRPRTGQGRVSPSSLANRVSRRSEQQPDFMAAWNLLLASSPSLNPSLRKEPERQLISRQYAKTVVDEFRADLYHKTALLTRVSYGLPKTSGQRIAGRYIDMLTAAGYFTQRADLLTAHSNEEWLRQSTQMLRQHGGMQSSADAYLAEDSVGVSRSAMRRHRMNSLLPRKRDILFKLELFTVCPDEPSPLDARIGFRPEEKEKIQLFRDLLEALHIGPADFGLASDTDRFKIALVSAARQTPRPFLANLLEVSTAPEMQRWVAQEVQLRPRLNQHFDDLVSQPTFASRYRGFVEQEKARFPDYPTPLQVRSRRRALRLVRTEQEIQAADERRKSDVPVESTVAPSAPKSV